MDNGKILIHCFESTGIEGFPSNTYRADDVDSALRCIKDVLENKNSGISRILIENPKFAHSTCYGDIKAMSPVDVGETIGGGMRNCERHRFSLASASMEYTVKNNLPLVSQWTQDIWMKFCAWLMDESEPDAVVLEEGQTSPTPVDRLAKAYIQSHGEYYSGWYRLIGFSVPVPLSGGRMAAGIYCNAGKSHECLPFVTMVDGSDSIPLNELDGMSRDAVIGAMLSEVESRE